MPLRTRAALRLPDVQALIGVSNEPTPGDLVFEAFLTERPDYAFRREPDWEAEVGVVTGKNPDYLVERSGQQVIAEVKSFETTKLHRRLMDQRTIAASAKETHGPIREAVRTAAKQLKPFAGAGLPLVVVLTNPRHIMVDLSEFAVIGAIMGDPQFVIPIGEGGGAVAEGHQQTGRDGVLLRERQYVSAVVVASESAADIYETGGTEAVPLPMDWLQSESGRRFGFVEPETYGERE